MGNKVFEELADFITFEYALDTNPSTTDFNTQTSLVGSGDMAITIGGNWSQPTYDAINPDLPVSLRVFLILVMKKKMISYIW